MGGMCHAKYEDSHRGFVQHAQKAAAVVLVCLFIWAATGFGYFWPVWVMLFVGLGLGGHARRVYLRPEEEPEREDEYV